MNEFLIPITVNNLPLISELQGRQGMFILPDGSININKKDGTWLHINKQSDHAGILKPQDIASVETGFAKWYWAGPGVYNNIAPGIIIDKLGIISYDGTKWSFVNVDLLNISKQIFDPDNNNDPAVMKATADRYDKLLSVNRGFIDMPRPDDGFKDITEASATYPGLFLQANNTTTSDSSYPFMGVIKDYDVTGYKRLEVNGMYYQNNTGTRPAILGIKADGTIVTILAYSTPDFSGFHSIDVSAFVKISMQVVQGAFPTLIRLFDGKGIQYTDAKKYADDRFKVLEYFLNPLGYTDVKNYIDESNKGRETKEGIVIDLNISSDYTFNVTTTSLQNLQIIPRLGSISNDIFNLKLVCELKPNIVFSDNIKFIGDQIPSFDSGFTYLVVFQTFDFGNTWFCSVVGAYSDKTKLLFNEQFKKGNITSLVSFNSNLIVSDGTKVSMMGAITGDSVFYKDVGSPFYTVSATFGLVNVRSKLVYKAIDNKNFGIIGYNGTPNKVSIIAVLNGAVADNYTIDVPGMNDRSNVNFKVKVGLTTWKFYVNEVLVKTFNNPAGLPGATKVGIIADTNIRDIYVKQLSISSNG